MRVVALDTTARAGSLALAIDGVIVEDMRGDASRTHGERLPQDILDLLARHRLRIADVDVYGLVTGPGSFTGLRVGIATVQGLASTTGRRVVAMSTFDVLAQIARADAAAHELIATVVDAQRGEVFAALYRPTELAEAVGEPTVAPPGATAAAWPAERDIFAIGDGAARYADLLRAAPGRCVRLADPPAPSLARTLAAMVPDRAAQAIGPHAIVPVYVRRPDAELARESRIR
jgi:tRNA threonylcarbamoyladenosine biosynthesis protein TsaB